MGKKLRKKGRNNQTYITQTTNTWNKRGAKHKSVGGENARGNGN